MLDVERRGPVAIVTLNRPEAMNALSKALRKALFDAMTALDADPDIAVVILTGAGENRKEAFLGTLQEAPRAQGRAVTHFIVILNNTILLYCTML